MDSYATSLLRDSILPIMQDAADNSSPLMTTLEKSSKGVWLDEGKGNYMISKNELEAEQGVGARAKGEDLESSHDGGMLDLKWLCKYNYAQFDIYGQDEVLSDTNPNRAVMSILTKKSKSIQGTFTRDRERQLWGNGSGKLCTVARDNTTGMILIVDDIANLEPNMYVDIHTGTVHEDFKITLIEPVKGPYGYSVTFEKSAETDLDVAAGTVITRAGALNNEMEGIRKICFPDSWEGSITWGTYGTQNRANYPDLRPVFIHNFGVLRNLTLELIDDLIFPIDANGCSTKVWFFMRQDMLQAVKKLRQAYGLNTPYLDLTLGYKAPRYECPKGEFPMVIANKCPANAIVALDVADTSIRRPLPPTWLKGSQSNILRLVEGKDKFRATLRVYENVVNVWPKHSGALVDVQKPV